MIETKRQQTARGAILFDAAAAGFDAASFDAAHWRELGKVHDIRGGRGGVSFVDAPFGASVIRHYRRGGMVARALNDVYFWTGEDRTRGFVEFRLLAALCDANLSVPTPVAARYERDGIFYRADLITRRIDDAPTFAEILTAGKAGGDVARRIGETLARFHAAGACHADLNAHNILVAADGIWLIDFDRGILRAPESTWRRANLSRLHRSCMKVLHADAASSAIAQEFDATSWVPLVRAYEQSFELLLRSPLRSVRT